MLSADLTAVLPELLVAIAGMVLLMVGVFRGNGATGTVLTAAVVVCLAALVLVWVGPAVDGPALAGLFVNDGFSRFMKVLALLAAALTMIMSLGFIRREGMERFEFPVLLLFATLGMMMMISANDLISLYVGLELQSLSLYVIAAFRKDALRSTEAGLKYFVLGALSSGMLLYGASMIYGFAGTTGFDGLATVIAGQAASEAGPSVGLIVGLVFLIAGLAFKISAVPFHMWTPDVYEGAPTPVTSFLAAAPKIAAMALFLRVMMDPFAAMAGEWRQIIVFISIASMVLGAFAALAQTNIKRLMAYSSIGHMGFALVGLAAGTSEGVKAVIVYMSIYLFMNLGTFVVILSMRQGGRMVEGIDDLAGLARNNLPMAAAMSVLMFSMAGIPPLAGFFGKFYVFRAAVQAELYTLAIIGVLASVVSAFYYLRIIKVMFFDEPVEAIDRPMARELGLILAATAVFVLVFIVAMGPLTDGASIAAAALAATP